MAAISGMLAAATNIAAPMYSGKMKLPPPSSSVMLVECSSRPTKKATAHHMKTRPKKKQAWDIRRKGPTAYPPLPVLPPDWTLVSSAPSEDEEAQKQQEVVEVAPALAAAAEPA